MIENQIYIRAKFENLSTREKFLTLLLTWALIYGIFYLIFFHSIDKQETTLLEEIKNLNNQIDHWNLQITALSKIASTPQYKVWLKEQESFHNLRGQYRYLLQESPSKRWQDIITTLLRSQSNITLVEIKNFPEAPYNPPNLNISSSKIFQQQLSLVIYSNYTDTLNYIQRLETVLPYIHWDTLNYQVLQYPTSKVEMEFSILYEKPT